VGSGIEWMIGVVSLIAGLAFLAVIPVLNFLSLGYMLAAGARVTESGRFRDSLIGVRKAAVAGRIVFGTWLVLWPVRATSELWNAAVLIDPGSDQTRNLRFVLVVLTFYIIWHIAWATLRGGKIRHYLWPAPLRFIKWLRTPDKFVGARDAVWDYAASLNLGYYFHLGFRGFAGALLWLMLPTLVLIAASNLPPGGGFVVSFLGALMLAPVVLFLPFLQAHFARTGELRQMFAVREIRRRFTHAPIAFWTALFVTFLFAVPLYLLKIELAPPEVAWLPSLVFVIFIFPARVLTGWAMHRSLKRETPTGCFVSWPARLAMVPAVFAYVLIVYSTQYLSWYGSLSLFEQHAFLVPAPMLGL
jgi:hypothetical protein